MCDQNSFYCLYRIDSSGSEIVTKKTYYNEEGIQMCQLHDNNETLFLFAIIYSSKLLVHFNIASVHIIDNHMPLPLTDYHLSLTENKALLYFRANNGPINSINCSFNDQEMQPVHFIQTTESDFSTLIQLNVTLNQSDFWYNCSVSSNNIILINPPCPRVNSVTCSVNTYFKGI